MKLFSLFCTLTYILSSAYAAPFTLICRPGGSQRIAMQFKRNGYASATFHFKKARQGASRGNLRPGECAWPHRALNRNEPSKIKTEKDFLTIANYSMASSGSSKMTFRYWPFQEDFDRRMAKNLEKLMSAIKSNQNFSIIAPYNSSRKELYLEKVNQ